MISSGVNTMSNEEFYKQLRETCARCGNYIPAEEHDELHPSTCHSCLILMLEANE